ncbi:hypothetical protein A5784_16340 [Mycobacterium sp. 852013-50091_SCH5140682]|uniref:hypothetical protein n=1 Tax=Mycobacterium sp. 852013-50091_SCH5140682 TaxID=1834109 RepID=UPI0007EB81C6|nr:hypothetical protein [Mycobacterium sp. 852013-50091_SCH5140682]OBC01976.1 hypothetical protein A5784_16340 [Mycobacterium sp. 852013-50091_SCH5140682]
MLRAIVCTSVLVAIGVPITACDSQALTSQTPSSTDTSVGVAQPDQAGVFFPAAVDTYGLTPPQLDRDHLAELHALRQIDPCGFVDQKTLAASGHPDFSYTYTAAPSIESSGNSPIAPLGGEGCTVTFPSAKTGLALQVLPGEPRWNDAQFSPDPDHPGVMRQAGSACTFRVTLPLTSLAGAPRSMRNPAVELTPVNIADNTPNTEDTSACPAIEAVSEAIAARAEHAGVPLHSAQTSPLTRFLSGDPCAAAVDLPTAGFVWKEPNPSAQWPTTWRHPRVCNLQLEQTVGGPATAVVKYGLVNWSENILKMPWGEDPQRDQQDGVELYTFSSYLAPGCLVIGKANVGADPVQIGAGAPGLVPATPVVTVRLNGPIGGSCANTAKQVALNALKRVI